MRILANENIPLPSIREIRAVGHEVQAVAEIMGGETDTAVLAKAAEDNLVIITFDRDYGELIFARKLPKPAGVIYLRFDPRTPTETSDIVLGLLATDGLVLAGRFTTVDRDKTRQRPLT